MNKKQASYIILLSIALSLLINIFFGRFLAATISTMPVLNRWKILSPQAPIVINTREEVRVADGTDTVKAVSLSRPKLSGIVANSSGDIALVASAVNLTSDGLFLTSKAILAGNKLENLSIKLDDGSMAKVSAVFADPATNLAVLKASLRNVPVANINSSAGLQAGDRIVFLSPTLRNFSPSFQASYIARDQLSDYTSVFDADKPQQAFVAQGTGSLLPGQAIVDLGGNIIGLWDGSNIVSGDVLKDFVSSFLSGGNKVLRPAYGFSYRNVSGVEASATGVPSGARVKKVTVAGPAQKAGLLEDDIITAVNDIKLTADNPLGGYLQKFKPGDKIKLSVARGNNPVEINITIGELK